MIFKKEIMSKWEIFINEEDFDLSIFGFNLKNISQTWKNIIGIGLICLVFGSILFGMKWIKGI